MIEKIGKIFFLGCWIVIVAVLGKAVIETITEDEVFQELGIKVIVAFTVSMIVNFANPDSKLQRK